jgi:5'-nucleotidase
LEDTHIHFLDKPIEIKNLDDKNVLINQVGCFGINLGKIDFYFSNSKGLQESENIKI